MGHDESEYLEFPLSQKKKQIIILSLALNAVLLNVIKRTLTAILALYTHFKL